MKSSIYSCTQSTDILTFQLISCRLENKSTHDTFSCNHCT